MNGLGRIGAYIAGTRGTDLPAAARELAALTLVDFVAAAVAGAREPVSQLAARHAGAAAAGEGATVIGHASRARPLAAAFINGTTGHALDFDDSNLVLGGHPSVVLYPALLALGETRGASGREIVDAYVIGFDVLVAFARAVNFEHYEKGWHPTATLGTFGAAAAAARLLGLDAQQSATAIALAASMASGVKANFGSMAKPLQVGEASRKGLLCALLAADGATASADALEGRQGFLHVYNGPGGFRAEALAAVGEQNELLRSGIHFKQYACCGSTHAPIDAAGALRKQHGLRAADVAAVRVAMNARRRPHVDRPVVDDELAAKFSVQYTVAAALADGFVGLQHFAPEAIARPDLQQLLRRVELGVLEGGDAALAQGCELTVQAIGGQVFSTRLDTAEGRDPVAYRGYMRQKFSDCVQHRFDPAAGDALLHELLAIDGCANVQPLVARLAGAPAH